MKCENLVIPRLASLARYDNIRWTRRQPQSSTSDTPNPLMPNAPLGIGFIGSGFNTRFHIQGFQAIRDADVRGVWSPNKKNAASAAELARKLDVGDARAHATITDMV